MDDTPAKTDLVVVDTQGAAQKGFRLPDLSRGIRDMIYKLIIEMHPIFILRQRIHGRTYPQPPDAFRSKQAMTMGGLEITHGSSALWAMLSCMESTRVEFCATTKECVSHQVRAELRDPVYGRGGSSSGELYLREEEAMFAHGCSEVFLDLTFTANTANNTFIETEVFDDIRYQLDHCSRAKTLVFTCTFKLKVPEGSTSATVGQLENDRRRLIVDHILPLIKVHVRLELYEVRVKFVVDAPLGNVRRNGEEQQPETHWAMRDPGMSWDDERIESYAIRRIIDDEGDVAWLTDRWNLSPLAARFCMEALYECMAKE